MARLYRRSFLENINTTQDELTFRVTRRNQGILLYAVLVVTVFIVAFLAWFFYARIPVYVEAEGIAVSVGGVREIAALQNGIISQGFPVGTNEVSAGDLLMKVSLPTVSQTYRDARKTYLIQKELLTRQRNRIEQRHETQLAVLNARKSMNEHLFDELSNILENYNVAAHSFSDNEYERLYIQKDGRTDLETVYEELFENSVSLFERNLLSASAMAAIERDHIQAKEAKSAVESVILRERMEQEDREIVLRDLEERVSSYKITLQDIDGQILDLFQSRDNDLQEIELRELNLNNELLDAERQLWLASVVYAPYDGTILLTKKQASQTVDRGEVLALMNIFPQKQRLFLVLSERNLNGELVFTYNGRTSRIFVDPEGVPDLSSVLHDAFSKLTEDTEVWVTKTDLGYIIRFSNENIELEQIEITKTTLLDAGGIPALAMLLTVGDNWQEKNISSVVMTRAQNSKRIFVGAEAHVKPDFEKNLIGTQLKAEVVAIGDYIVTDIETQSLIGNADVAQSLNQSNFNMVSVTLRFVYSKDGQIQTTNGKTLMRSLTPGTTIRARIYVEQLSPYAILVPYFGRLFSS